MTNKMILCIQYLHNILIIRNCLSRGPVVENDVTGVIQMMLPVLSSEYFLYHHMQSTAVVRVDDRQP